MNTRQLLQLMVFATLLVMPCSQAQSQQDASGPIITLPNWGYLPQARHRHGSVVAGGRVYIMGGVTPDGWTNSVNSAPIEADGRLGTWRTENSLLEARGFLTNSVCGTDKYIYVVAGNSTKRMKAGDNEMHKTPDVLWTEIGPDGVLGQWRRSFPLHSPPLSCVAATVADGYLVLTGGSADAGVMDAVQIARIAPDGAPGAWSLTVPLPKALWFHGMAFVNGKLYAWGGLSTKDRADVNAKTFSARFSNGVVIGPWKEDVRMEKATYAAACIGARNRLVSLGGRYANDYPTGVLCYCKLDAASTSVSVWDVHRTDLQSRVGHSIAYDATHDIAYVTGGIYAAAPTNAGAQIMKAIQAFRIGD